MTNKQWDIILLTQKEFLNPSQIDDYLANVLLEDRLLLEALQAQGLRVKRLNWDAKDFDWASTEAVLFRATWDYFHRFSEFKPWLDHVVKQTKLINSHALIKWSMDKHYLADLARQGINIPPTQFIEQGESINLQQAMLAQGWTEAILKPAIAGGARHTYRLNQANVASHQALFEDLISNEAMLLQAFQQAILTRGEVSYILFGGRYSHAVLKKAKAGDFRVQDDFGGTVHPYQATAEERAFVERALDCCPQLPFYARVDVMWDNHQKLCLSELELIEPELWFRKHEPAASQLAELVARSLNYKVRADSHGAVIG